MALRHSKLRAYLAPYLLQALEPREAEALRRHLASGCASCQAELEALRPALFALSDAATTLPAPSKLRARLIDRIKAPRIELTQAHGEVKFQGGLLRTGLHAEAELKVRGEALVYAMPQSLLRLWRSSQGLCLRLEKGAAMVQVQSGQAFRALLPLGQIAVRGTYFFVESRGPRDSYFCLCEGWVGLEAPGLKTELKSEDHLAMTLHQSGSRTLSIPASGEHAEPDLSPLD
jgi:hypothetical protein